MIDKLVEYGYTVAMGLLLLSIVIVGVSKCYQAYDHNRNVPIRQWERVVK